MKKILLVIATISVLAGCTTTKKEEMLTCTSNNSLNNITSKTTYKLNYQDNNITKMTVTYEYKDNHTDGVGTGTDGTTADDKDDNNGVIDGVVGEALDDVVTGVTDTILDISGIKTRHNTRFGTYSNIEGFTTNIDRDSDNDYQVTYTYDLTKLSDTDINTLGINKDLNTQKNNLTNQGLTCK